MTGVAMKRVALGVFLTLVIIQLSYLAAGNAVLASDLPRNVANQHPELISIQYRRAFTPWPGRLYVRDLALRFQNDTMAFSLTMATSRLDVSLLDFFGRKFKATHARGTDVTYRMLLKVKSAEGIEERLAAFPPIDRVTPLRPQTAAEPPLSPKEIDQLWSMELHDVVSEVSEVWLFEYRYQGRGKSVGSFGIEPMKRVWVGPVSLDLEPGKLSLGPHVVSEKFSMRSEGNVAPFSIATTPGLETFAGMTGTVELDLPLETLAFATVYLPGSMAGGEGRVFGSVQLESGKLGPATKLDVALSKVAVAYQGFGFSGAMRGNLTVSDKPLASATAEGTVSLPMPEGAGINASVGGVYGSLSLASADLSEGVQWRRAYGNVEQIVVADARPLVKVASSKAPFFAQALLGDGPLTSSGSVEATPQQTVIRVRRASLGRAEVHGAVALRGKELFGAAEAHAGAVIMGVELDANEVKVNPLPEAMWLETQLSKHGLDPAFRTQR